MSKLVFNDDKSKGQVQGAVLAYVKMQEGAFKYQSTTEKEYTVDCIVDKATAKAYAKIFQKNKYREIDTEDFKAKYKIDPPFPDQEEQYILKIKNDVGIKVSFPKYNLSVGDPVPYEWSSRPKVYVPIDGGVKDITMTTLVANGSVGDIAFNITENSFGRFPKLSGILVKELIEYESSGGGNMSDFGNVVGGYNPGDGNTQQVADTGRGDDIDDDIDNSEEQEPEFDDSELPF